MLLQSVLKAGKAEHCNLDYNSVFHTCSLVPYITELSKYNYLKNIKNRDHDDDGDDLDVKNCSIITEIIV